MSTIHCSWPPLHRRYWELQPTSACSVLEVQLRGQEAPLVVVPEDTYRMGGRIEPLLQVASVAAWRLGKQKPQLRFQIQVHDEQPQHTCLRFDAAASDSGILLPDPYALGSQGYKLFRDQLSHHPLPAWKKRWPIAFWRGSSTGTKALTVSRLPQNPRYQLCQLSQLHPLMLDARLTSVVQCRDQDAMQLVQDTLERDSLLAPRSEPWTFAQHRFLIEIDGNVNSWGLLWKLLSGSCVLRVESNRRQWYHSELQPFRHFVPVTRDLSDLIDKLQWCQSHTDQCERIAAAGHQLAMNEIKQLGRRVVSAVDDLGKQF